MRGAKLLLPLALLCVVLVQEVAPQSATVSINNQALFGLGAVLLASGVAYHVGRQNGLQQPSKFRGGPRRQNSFPFFGRRRRRQTQDEPLNELDPLVGQLFQMALDRDTTGCSLQLSCAVGGLPDDSLTGHAKNLNRVLSSSNSKTEESVKSAWSGLDAHRTALDLGRDGGGCDQLFPYCPHSSKQLIAMFQKLQVFES